MTTPLIRSSFLFSTLLFALAPFLLLPETAEAQPSRQRFDVNMVLSDGKDGRVWRQWRQNIPERQVESVEIVAQRVKGGDDTYVNLRFGSGSTFENGKQEYVRPGEQRLRWNVDAAPRGEPLVLNAYKGEVRIESVTVNFASSGPGVVYQRPGERPRDRPRSDDRRSSSAGSDRWDTEDRCRRARRIKPPRIDVGNVKSSGGLFSGKYRIEGSMYGACVQEAGYFENGRLRQRIEFPVTDAYERREFSIRTETGKNGELRIYTFSGDEDTVFVDELVVRSRSDFN